MKRYTKKAAGLIFLLLATSVTFGLLVAFQFYISAIVTFALILFEGYYLFHMMERSDPACSNSLSGRFAIPTFSPPALLYKNRMTRFRKTW